MNLQWRKSAHSGGVDDQHCVELARHEQAIWVRDSKDPSGGHLSLTSVGFASLLSRIKRDVER
jgi:hypothetical protein